MNYIINKIKTLTFFLYIIKRKFKLYILKSNDNHLKNRILKNTYKNPKMSKIQETLMKTKFNLIYDKKNLYGYTQGSPNFFGYVILGNIYFDFVNSLIKEIRKDKIEKLYFLSRDGEIIKKVYDILSQGLTDLPKSNYLYASRRSLNTLSINSIECVIELMQEKKFANCKIEDIFYNRFGCDKKLVREHLNRNNYSKYDLVYSNKSETEFVIRLLEDIIMERIKFEKDNLINYYKEQGLLSNEKMAIVDIGHEGSLQKALYKYLDKKITGYYFATFYEIKENVEKYGMKTWGYVGNGIINKLHFYKSNLLFLENIFLNSDKSFAYIEEGKICTVEEKASNRSIFADEVHLGIVNYISDIYDFIGEDINQIPLENNPKKGMENLLNLINNPTMADVEIFENIIFENQYSCMTDKYLIDKEARTKSIWQEGFIISKKL